MIAAEARPMLHRRITATAVAALVLLVGATISACGFDAPTDRVNTIAAGVHDRSAKVDLLGIRVLSDEAGQGRLIGSLANNTPEDGQLSAVAGEGVTVAEFPRIVVPAGDQLNLAAADTPTVGLSGEFEAGGYVTLDFTVVTDETETVSLDVPVVKNCHQYTQVPEPEAPAAEDTEPAAADDAADEEHSEDPAYICDHPTGDAGH